MLYNVKVKRTFTGGILEGIEIEQEIVRLSERPNIGDIWTVKHPVYGSPYVDQVVDVTVYGG